MKLVLLGSLLFHEHFLSYPVSSKQTFPWELMIQQKSEGKIGLVKVGLNSTFLSLDPNERLLEGRAPLK